MSARWQPEFDINDPEKFDYASPRFDKPTEIGYFSLDIDRHFEISKKSLRYFIRPENPERERVTFDLRKGYDTMIKNTNERDKETHLFEWIMEDRKKDSNQEDATRATEGPLGNDIPVNKQENPDPFSVPVQDTVNVDQEPTTDISKVDISTKDKRKSDFVCRRGLLVKIMCTPYEEKEDWLIAVQRHNGTYYLHEFETEQEKEAEKEKTEKQKEMCCWGWKFEQYITADTKDGKPNPDAVYNNCEAFYTVVIAKLNDHSLVFSGEVDAASNDENENYVEFKTSGPYLNRNKLMKWWAQSYIIGVKDIVRGVRNDDGVVYKLEIYKTEKLPALAKKGGYMDWDKPWKRNVCLNALDKFLTFIKSSITTDDSSKVYTLTWKPGQLVQCTNYNFLPDGFTDVVK